MNMRLVVMFTGFHDLLLAKLVEKSSCMVIAQQGVEGLVTVFEDLTGSRQVNLLPCALSFQAVYKLSGGLSQSNIVYMSCGQT